jgi:hypothetical protein
MPSAKQSHLTGLGGGRGRVIRCHRSCQLGNRLVLPAPTIIETTRSLYARHTVHDTARSNTEAVTLAATSAAVERIITEARERRQYLKNTYRVLRTRASDNARAMRARGRPRPDSTSCSQIRTTIQPFPARSRFVRASRIRLRRIFNRQYAMFDFGTLLCFSHPCQKHPSTKTATLRSRKTKSGRMGLGCDCFGTTCARPCLFRRGRSEIGACRLQPVMPAFRSAAATDRSVDILPVERIEAMIWLRRDCEKISAIGFITF